MWRPVRYLKKVRQVFRNSRLIGRRFRLAHVRFGREIIEVATFRGSGDGNNKGQATQRKKFMKMVEYCAIMFMAQWARMPFVAISPLMHSIWILKMKQCLIESMAWWIIKIGRYA